jgi:nicotinamide-nucleotide amidase
VGVGITGVAGPTGGTPDKPVGLVHLCVRTPSGEHPLRLNIPGGRSDVRVRAVQAALHLIRRALSETSG